MKRKSRTKRIYLNESMPISLLIIVAFFLLIFTISNRVLAGVELYQRGEVLKVKIRSNTIELLKLNKIIPVQVERARKIENEIINIYEYWGRFGG